VKPVIGVLIDTCGWVAVVEARINIDLALQQQLGPIEIKVTQSVMNELERLAEQESRNLLLSILTERAELVSGEGEHTDDELLNLATNHHWPVLTVDKDLKNRLYNANASVIEVHGSKALRYIE
jgi:rRNA-processing protein FCF1|tara:strand:+ start:568 stop:939 length:372 start_codon:yes stop_codon:yes gene_type:complete